MTQGTTIDHVQSRAVDAAWLASYRLGQSWEERVIAVQMARKTPYRALTCYEAILRSYK